MPKRPALVHGQTKPSRFTLAFGAAWVLLMIGVAGIVYATEVQRAANPRTIGGPFTMADSMGRIVTAADLRGRPTALFFGFTGCPETCPTTLQDLTDVLGRMGPRADRLNVVFVTVDPARDTPEQMRSYLTSFDPRIRALIGTEAQLAAMATAYHVQYRRVPLEGGDYTMEHSAAILLFDERGRFAGAMPYGTDEKAMQARLETLVGTAS